MKETWKIVSGDGTSMYRAKGKTWPCIEFCGTSNTIFARDNNSKKPSERLSTKDLSVDGVYHLLRQGISYPWPEADTIMEFIINIEKTF